MAESVPDPDDYLEEVVEETPLLFASSGAILTIEDPNLHPIGRAIAIFLIFVSMLGFLNGLDYASPDDGLVRPDEFVYRLAQTAPEESATFRGTIYDHDGAGLANATVYISWLNTTSNMWLSTENLTETDGSFEFQRLNPGLVRVDIIAERDEYRDVFSNRVLLSPPALIEPIGFTTLDFTLPPPAEFAAQPCDSNDSTDCEIRTIDMTSSQMDHPLMDPSAATTYVLVGFGFMGLALISAGFAVWTLKNGSIMLLRTSSVLSMFTMGHYYSACIFGLLAFVLTFAVPRRRIPLTD
ncbi:MAG: carboxypeptidase regulatory-like domain-containing protein [Candidatus Poseidonia sp.]|nr:carboxypeptidase regulatory-like domain-containing protein [Poseidonia sp.]MBL6748025.1 carboxypeptidase regulatory-like domain-containing protein [Poseidonia sp.]MBL6806909.1 carboxypeptidase regulatory-like domain-containing protein [Poseidonia sp.]MBL6885925.1 carboxypeptidase regulatory-like domain-containing protein [Poseidonia sp.]MBL6892803.1 carboxypeptidase regulatory-like domain-containing protein [Poseidonia sp.]